MQYISGRRINQDFGVPGITTNDTVVNVDGRIAVGIGTSATTDIDTNQIRIRDNIIDSRGVIGSMGYFLTKDVEGVTWTNVPPLGNNSIFLAEDGDILNNIGLQTYTGLNIISDQLLGITTNPDNPGFADIRIDPRWFRDRTPGGGGGIYTTGTVGIGLTQPRLGPVGVLTDVKLDVLGDAIFTGVVSATSFTGEFNVNTQDLNVSGIASFNGTTDNVIGDTNTGIVQINGGVGIDKNVSIGASLDVNNLLTVGSAVTIGNGAVIANTGDFINLELDNLNVIGFSTFGNTARFNSAVNIFDDLFVSGNISVGGTGVTLDTETIRIEGKELLIGFTTTITPNDTTANAGGIAVASTEGYFLADLQISGINTTPNTYKQFKWFKSGAFVGQSTDAFITNQPISIGRTQIQNGQLFAVGNSINFTEDQITAPTFVGNLTGTASTASFATTAFTLDGRVESEFNVATAVTATNLANAANITTGTINASRLTGDYNINITGVAATASFATTAFTLDGKVESEFNVATAVTATNLADAANITTGTISDARLGGPYTIDIVGSASTASFATTAFTLNGGAGGQVVYQSAADTTAFLSNGTLGQVLISNGGTNAPQWGDAASSGSISGITIQDESSPVGSAGSISTVNFIGDGVVATASGSISTITISQSVNGSGGIANTATNVIGGIASVTQLNVSGISTLGTVEINSGVITATSGVVTYYGDGQYLQNIITQSEISNQSVAFAQTAGLSTETTRLQNARTFQITGDVVASPISFNGTGNVSLAATIQPNSVELSTDTTGNYVESISGTGNQITVTNGSGEGSTPTISIVNNPTLPGNVTVQNDLTVNGNLLIVGSGATVIVDDFKVSDKNIIAGFTTNASGNEVSSDSTANAGGIAVASTVGNPLVDLTIAGIDTHPSTYKRLYWYQSAAFAGLGTDAWLTNYALGVGTTQFPTGTYFAAGNVQITENDLAAVRNINASGVVTATGGFSGNLTGTASTASFATTAFSLNGIVESDLNVATAVTATNLANAANITTGTINASRLTGDYNINITGVAATASFATTAFTLDGKVESEFNVATAVTATNLADAANITTGTISDARLGGPYTIDIVGSASTASFATTAAGIASDVNIFTTGIATIGTVKIASGIVTATTGVVTYYGDGSNLTGINPGITSISISSNVENQSQYLTYATSIGNTTGLGVTTGGLTFNPSTGRMGIGATSPVTDLHILSGTSSFSPVTNFDKLVIENQNGGQGAVLQLVSPNKSEIGFSDATRNAGLLSYDHNTNAMHFDSNNVARATIDSNGNLGIGTNTPTNAVATSNTKILNVGVVTANNYYGSGANLTNLTGASAATYGNATNVAQVVVDANGRITGISNVAISGGGTNGVTIENNGSSVGTAITTINFSSNVTATASGSIATITSSGGGGGDTYQFNTGVTSSISLAATGVGITALTLPSTAGKQYTIYSINASNVATGNTEVNFIGAFDFSGGERSYFAYNLPVPTGLSIEALKQPQILNPSDRITIRSTDFVRNGADDIIDVYITYKEETSSDYFGVGIGTVGIAVTTNIGIYTSSTYPSVVQSIRLANRTDVGGKPISVAINNGIRTTYLIDNLIVPKYASIELLETPKRLSTNDVIEVQVDETECIDIQISGKKITS